MDIDYSDLEKIYMIRHVKSKKHVGFRLSTGNKAYTYKKYGSAKNYINKHCYNKPTDYEIDVFVCVHRGLPEECKKMY